MSFAWGELQGSPGARLWSFWHILRQLELIYLLASDLAAASADLFDPDVRMPNVVAELLHNKEAANSKWNVQWGLAWSSGDNWRHCHARSCALPTRKKK